jgi:hypothetical protein
VPDTAKVHVGAQTIVACRGKAEGSPVDLGYKPLRRQRRGFFVYIGEQPRPTRGSTWGWMDEIGTKEVR